MSPTETVPDVGPTVRTCGRDEQASVTWCCSEGRGLFSATAQSLPVPPRAGAGGPRAAPQSTAE